ncbi:sensor histidine kinase [Ferrimonas aestuarii]|nr:sensor histidine kinase [Ferrimonas aestuarii]
MSRRFSLFLMALIIQVGAMACCVAAEPEAAELKVGVLANWGGQQAERRWQPMMDYLSERVDGARFSVVPGSFEELNQAMLAGQIQFIVSNPGQYLHLSNQFPLSWLATMRSRQHRGTTYAIGSAIVVRADSKIKTLYDLKDKTVAASGFYALGGYQAALGLMRQFGIDPESYWKEIRFLGFPLGPLVFQVRDKNIDAAITPFCTLEKMVERGVVRRNDFRVLNPSRPEGYDCQVSTQLYPNWSFAASEQVLPHITKQVTEALFELDASDPAAIAAETLGWTAPISQLKVIQLFSNLDYQAKEVNNWQPIQDWIEKNQHWGLTALALFLMATFYHIWIEFKFRQKSDRLLQTERELKQKAIQLERLHSAAVVGEIGAGLAHEINQPIAAINNYSEGGLMRLQGQTQPDTEMVALLDKINQQSKRAGAVVHRIRGLLKRHETVLEKTNLLDVVDDSLDLLKLELERHQIRVQSKVNGEPKFVMADKVGLLQVLVNLIKNSADAMAESPQSTLKQIFIEVSFNEELVTLSVTDNGPGLQEEPHKMLASFSTTKEQGLGLGLAIVSDLIKQHQGQFRIDNCPETGGCRAQFSLPLLMD